MTAYQPLIDAQFKKAKAEGGSAKRKSTPAKYLGLIRVDQEALRRGGVEGDERCEIAGLGPIPVERSGSCWAMRSSSS